MSKKTKAAIVGAAAAAAAVVPVLALAQPASANPWYGCESGTSGHAVSISCGLLPLGTSNARAVGQCSVFGNVISTPWVKSGQSAQSASTCFFGVSSVSVQYS